MTLKSLLSEMVSLDLYARIPEAAYRTKLSSSYDRRQVASDAEGWFANYDRGNFDKEITVDGRTEWVMLDAEGPGAIVRIWTATPQGTLRVYLDCQPEPVIELPMVTLFDGDTPRFGEPFAYSVTEVSAHERGANLYFPIPFQQRAIVTTDAGVAMEGSESVDLFYEVNYRQYPSGTTVETFSDEAYEAAKEGVRATAERLASSSPSGGDSAALERASFMLDPGDPDSMFRMDAPASGAVVRELTIDSIADLDLEEQREIDVVVRFDGEETIRAPLPDLFGAGPKAAAYESLPVTIEPTGTMRLRWPMPFQTTMELQLQTDADLGMATISGELVWEPDEWGSESLHFHAGRRASRGFEARRHDRNLVEIRGRGTYVGNALTVINDSKCWWGEGDQRMWVDDEEFPSHLGTGTEDYYGYAWAQTDVFDRPYHAQPQYEAGQGTDDCGRGEDLGGTASMNRWHVIDAIPFDDAFRFDLEIWHWNPDARLALSSVHYWYARPGGTDNLPEEGPRDVVSVGDLR